jgi:hypothetical protein
MPGSVADPDPGSGALLTPGSGIGFFRIPDLGSRLSDNFFGKKEGTGTGTLILCELAKILFLIFNFVMFEATKKGRTTNFFPSLFCNCCCWIGDQGSWIDKYQDPGSGINIPDPQDWYRYLVSIGLDFYLSFHLLSELRILIQIRVKS